MLSIVEGIFLFVAIIESILGVLGNGFIVLVYCIDCIKNKFSLLGFILTGLAISRICLIWIIIIDGLIWVFPPDTYYSEKLKEYICYMWVLTNQSTVWFATSLNIFYFLKIANFSHYIFLWLKMRIGRILPLLMGSLFISWLATIPQVMKAFNDNKMKNRNTTWRFNMNKNEFFIQQFSLNLVIIFFFTLSLITCFLLIISLWRHNRKMQLNGTGFRDPNTDAHVKAMKVLISFIILFILYFIGFAIEISYSTLPENKLLILGMTISAIYLWSHSFILILGNSKLKQASLQILQQLKCKRGGNLRTRGLKRNACSRRIIQ
ncbi:taste receptor type 2 member 10-like [Nycticebus coucang]|uniref:taste receptor type 2 member 10-like n=1 Tax=Nycticebus coucang TaxID=9470 RepID=UPI00234DF524|nr:taste receptor type 2 member 10-like [Nycticebus coucang]